ncbi:GAF domain-containing protein [Anaerosolibacter carboniphilus]|uniref:GAF domain-containing protein n=1 Tax=Anaerosolibacter carboniphilus TaxID=1417629 RepID=A0A841KQU3_9FIRM|nr:hypothetical protein [Anaerosolibacter carboniphilus]MBB6214498.1 GAF domain-containing protein [Anaerosolibacter carboniphilus]
MDELKTTNKIYRYEALLQAIDFFTQRFHLDQLGNYAFDFANEMLTLNASILFIWDGDVFVQKGSRLCDREPWTIPNSQALEELPIFHGDIITNRFEAFFTEEVIKKSGMRLVIPLIMHDLLHGFIISNGKILGSLNEDDLIIASALTKLFRNSLENSRQIHELYEKNKQLDQKIFNLFAINQSAKSLLSEVSLSALYALATDVFSETTCSKVTSFGMYDPISKSIKVLGYRNVSTYTTFVTELHLLEHTYQSQRVVLELEKDREIIESIFSNGEEFEALQAKYVILLVKDEILGVVTLSEPVNDNIYDHAVFELVETLASFTHIAISNALLFKEIVTEKERAERKFDILNTLNKIIRNINHSTNIEELSILTLKVLSLNFGIKKAFFAYRSQNDYVVRYGIGLGVESAETKFTLNDEWENALHGEMILDFREDAVQSFFEKSFIEQIGGSNCIVISPICTGRPFLHEVSSPIGFLIVLETKDSLKEEEILLIDTIANNITPVIYQMDLNQRIRGEYRVDPLQQFLRAAERKLAERKEYGSDFYLYYKIVDKSPFEKFEDMFIEGEECYVVDNLVFLFTYETMNRNLFCKIPHFEWIEELVHFDYQGFYHSYRDEW